jgi:hypothetical protein
VPVSRITRIEKSMRRTGGEVATQAIIFSALGFRASLEVTQHRRTIELCSQLLPWLEQLGLGGRIEAYHRELLESPHGSLPSESQTEAAWWGETAAVLGWAICLLDRPHPTSLIDPNLLVRNLRILQPTASDILASAQLRSRVEIEQFCALCVLVRQHLQLAVLPTDVQATLTTIHQARIAELDLTDAVSQLKGIEVEIARLAANEPHGKGLYVVRALAAEWLLRKEH